MLKRVLHLTLSKFLMKHLKLIFIWPKADSTTYCIILYVLTKVAGLLMWENVEFCMSGLGTVFVPEYLVPVVFVSFRQLPALFSPNRK